MVRERATQLAGGVTDHPDDPFDCALLTDTDLESEPARLEEELSAISMMGGRRLVRLQLTSAGGRAERTAVEALAAHMEGRLNPEAFLLIEAGDLGRDSGVRRAAEKANACAAIPCYEDEPGDIARFTREALAANALLLRPRRLTCSSRAYRMSVASPARKSSG